MGQTPEQLVANKILAIGEKSRELFLVTIPPGTWVWETSQETVFGITIGGQRIYADPTCDTVAIGSINNNPEVSGIWDVENVCPMK